VQATQVRGEVVSSGFNWLIAKDLSSHYKVYNVPAERKFIVDGISKTLSELQPGTLPTATATTREKSRVDRITTTTKGTVVWDAPRSIIVTLEGESEQYEVPGDCAPVRACPAGAQPCSLPPGPLRAAMRRQSVGTDQV
jgi:hypothetical protein